MIVESGIIDIFKDYKGDLASHFGYEDHDILANDYFEDPEPYLEALEAKNINIGVYF